MASDMAFDLIEVNGIKYMKGVGGYFSVNGNVFVLMAPTLKTIINVASMYNVEIKNDLMVSVLYREEDVCKKEQPMYTYGYKKANGKFGMFKGPIPQLDMSAPFEDETAYIFYNEAGVQTPVYRWSNRECLWKRMPAGEKLGLPLDDDIPF